MDSATNANATLNEVSIYSIYNFSFYPNYQYIQFSNLIGYQQNVTFSRSSRLTAALTKPRLNSSSYKLCIYTFP